SRGNLLVPVDVFIPEGRINALLHHEVGTHIVTWANGKSQRLSQLHTGFAGYDELQEGLAVLAEYLVGELSVARMRLLAGRVIAVRRLIEGETFPGIFHELRAHGFTEKQSFTISMRVWRSGGLTKDAVYLRGLVRLLQYLATGGDLDLLFIGKITEEHVDLVRELRRRRILREPPLRPRYLEMPESIERLEHIRGGASLLDLIRKEN
ncbi:MAG: flavohemoglobin expression-modulating QEGLA motif protein, partial [Acidobacteria bacterium]|nr:flavohemoglobin expression-modulating QEGLA motif protein [Acidobacteriota bacterium]